MDQAAVTRKRFVGLGLGSAAAAAIGTRAQRTAQAQEATPDAEGTPVARITTAEETWVNGEENLTYNNPFGMHIAPFWYEGMKGYHLNLGVATEEPPYPIAEQYLFVYADEVAPAGTPVPLMEAPLVEGQLVVFDSVPGDENYSPIWHNNWVLVPPDYEPNSIRSVQEVMESGYEVRPSPIWVN